MDEGGPSFPNCLLSAGPTEPGLCVSPPSPQPSHCIEQTPGNARPWWAGPDLSLAVLEGPRVPSGCGHCKSKWGDTWPSVQLGQAKAPLAQWSLLPRQPLHQPSPHPGNSWCFQGNYLTDQQCRDCGGRATREGALFPVLGPQGTTPAGQRSPDPHLHTGRALSHGGKGAGVRAAWTLLQTMLPAACCVVSYK